MFDPEEEGEEDLDDEEVDDPRLGGVERLLPEVLRDAPEDWRLDPEEPVDERRDDPWVGREEPRLWVPEERELREPWGE